jgi:anaerobic magnesium-protoporphyrin IX monomethyl ester cyclase
VLGGPEVAPDNEYLFEHGKGIDYFVRGEGEETFLELVQAAMRGERPEDSKILALSHWDAQRATVVHHPPRQLIEDLSRVPSTLLGPHPTQRVNAGGRVLIESMRGCPSQCSFCAYFKGTGAAHHVRYFPLERVLAEIDLALSQRPRNLYLMDPTFHADRERAVRILEFLAERNRCAQVHIRLEPSSWRGPASPSSSLDSSPSTRRSRRR